MARLLFTLVLTIMLLSCGDDDPVVTPIEGSEPEVSFNSYTKSVLVEPDDSLEITATAVAKFGKIEKVILYFDGVYCAEKKEQPYEFTLKNIPFGTHNIQLKAYDTRGAVGYSLKRIIDAPNLDSLTDLYLRVAPNIYDIGNFFEGDTARLTTNFKIGWNRENQVKNVQFFINDSLIGEAYSVPYSYKISSMPAGNLSIYSKVNFYSGLYEFTKIREIKVYKK